jgi:hypothetical protein
MAESAGSSVSPDAVGRGRLVSPSALTEKTV